jgi:hypothetical protein
VPSEAKATEAKASEVNMSTTILATPPEEKADMLMGSGLEAFSKFENALACCASVAAAVRVT